MLLVHQPSGAYVHKVKGDICIDPHLGMKFLVPSTSIKISALGRSDDIVYGLDVGRTTARAMKTPGLSAVVWSPRCARVCLRMYICMYIHVYAHVPRLGG